MDRYLALKLNMKYQELYLAYTKKNCKRCKQKGWQKKRNCSLLNNYPDPSCMVQESTITKKLMKTKEHKDCIANLVGKIDEYRGKK